MPTEIGLLFLVVFSIGWLFNRDWGYCLLIACLPFQASTVLIFGDQQELGLQPAYVALMIAALGLPLGSGAHSRFSLRAVRWAFQPLLFLAVWVFFVTAVAPLVFPGTIEVMPMRSVGSLVPLARSPSNLRHLAYLAVSATGSFALAARLAQDPKRMGPMIMKAWIAAAFVAVFFMGWHALSLYAGWYFPREWLHNNPGAAQLQFGYLRPELQLNLSFRRLSGSFTEPSLAALFLSTMTAFSAGYFVLRRAWVGILWFVLNIALLLATGATTGYFSGAVIGGFLLAWTSSSAFRKGRPGRLLMLTVIMAVAIIGASILSDSVRYEVETIANLQVFNKIEDERSSPAGRYRVESNAWAVLISSYGFGVGLGSNMSYTLVGYVASNLGVPGILLFGWLLRRTWGMSPSLLDYNSAGHPSIMLLKLGMLAALSAGLVGVPLLQQPVWWALLGSYVGLAAGTIGVGRVLERSAPDHWATAGRGEFFNKCA